MRRVFRLLVVAGMVTASVVAIPGTASASLYTCDEAGLDQALADGGGPHFFDCGGPTYIPLSGEKLISNDVILEGGHNLILSGQNSHRIFTVAPGVTAELHEIVFTEGYAGAGGAVRNIGTLVIGGSEMIGNYADDCGGAVHNPGTLVIGDTFFEGNAAGNSGGAVCSTGGDLTVFGAGFVNNHASSSWGGAIAASATATIEGSNFHENSAQFGGALALLDYGSLHVVESDISGNWAHDGGGGIYVFADGSLTVERTHIGGNSAPNSGGGIFAERFTTVDVAESHIEGNEAYSGGGLHATDGDSVAVRDSAFTGNHAGAYGGGMYLYEVPATVERSYFEGNVAEDRGGAVDVSGEFLEISEVEMVDNHASSHGGGLFARQGASVVVRDSNLSGNSATWGGAAQIREDASLAVSNTSITNNSAGTSGGGLGVENGVLTVVGSFIADNVAGLWGGGIESVYAITDVVGTLFVGNHADEFGGAIDSWDALSLGVTDSAILYNSAGDGGGIYNYDSPGFVNYSCIDGNTDTAVNDNSAGMDLTRNWWGAPDGPSGPTGTGSGDSLWTLGTYVPWSPHPLDPCLFAQAPWNPGRPSTGVCEVLVWFDEIEILSDTDDDVDQWRLSGAARFYDADDQRDRETAVIGIADFEGDAGDVVVLEQQWRTEVWAAFDDQIRFDDLGIVLYEDDGRFGDDRGRFWGSPNVLFECGDTFEMSMLVGAAPMAARGQPVTDSAGLVRVHMTITTVDTWMPPPRAR